MTIRILRRMSLVLGGLMVALTSGCGLSDAHMPMPSQLSPKPTPTSSAPRPPEKYPMAGVSCSKVTSGIQGLPPLLEQDQTETTLEVHVGCPFLERGGDEKLVVFSIRVMAPLDQVTGVLPGAKRAQEEFDRVQVAGDGRTGLSLGTASRWGEPTLEGGCVLYILDDNALFHVAYGPGSAVIAEERCRTIVRDYAEKFYSAVQAR